MLRNTSFSTRVSYHLSYSIIHTVVLHARHPLTGPEDVSRLLLLTAGAYGDALHDEIWVYDQGWWQKSRSLWAEVQKASWNDVILKEEFKKALQKDVYGFFASEQIYKDLNIPWKVCAQLIREHWHECLFRAVMVAWLDYVWAPWCVPYS